MIVDYAIREKVAQYLTGGISLDQFEDWLVQSSWNMHRGSDAQSQKLASAIELRLAEHSSGHLSEVDLRAELSGFVTKYVINAFLNSAGHQQLTAAISLGSSNEPVNVNLAEFQVAFPVRKIPEGPPPADTSLVVGYA